MTAARAVGLVNGHRQPASTGPAKGAGSGGGWVAHALATALLLACSSVAAAQTAAPEIVPRATRNVTPPGMTPGPSPDGPLIRLPPPPKEPEPARWRRYPLPRTTDSATFVVGRATIRVSGVAALPLSLACRRADTGAEWPCGQLALEALRKFLRGRPVECYFPPAGDATLIIAPCRVGSTDLGLWLLREGWAEPDEQATDEYRAAAREARCARRGRWRGNMPEDGCPTAPVPQAAEIGAGTSP